MAMDLEEYRIAQRLSYGELAEQIGLPDESSAGRIARGERWPKPERIEQIVSATGGKVTVAAMHARRLAWWRARQSEASLAAAE